MIIYNQSSEYINIFLKNYDLIYENPLHSADTTTSKRRTKMGEETSLPWIWICGYHNDGTLRNTGLFFSINI